MKLLYKTPCDISNNFEAISRKTKSRMKDDFTLQNYFWVATKNF